MPVAPEKDPRSTFCLPPCKIQPTTIEILNGEWQMRLINWQQHQQKGRLVQTIEHAALGIFPLLIGWAN
jgi:hypothetical protein